jgi:hypothetical protein
MTATHTATSTEDLRKRATEQSRKVVEAVDAAFDALDALVVHLAAAPTTGCGDVPAAAVEVIEHGERASELLDTLRAKALAAAEFRGKRTVADDLATKLKLLFPPAPSSPGTPADEEPDTHETSSDDA